MLPHSLAIYFVNNANASTFLQQAAWSNINPSLETRPTLNAFKFSTTLVIMNIL